MLYQKIIRMNKLKILFTVISIAMAMGSCSLVPWDEIESLNVEPTRINKMPKIYPGGNVECSTTGIEGLVETTGRNNYDQSLDKFENGWPSGLLVLVTDDKYISFQIDESINLGDGKCYKVGAVIVKGSDASNVYDYTDIGGATMDQGLVAPNNSSGGPAALSNLTFCFVECEEPEQLVIALKSFYWPGPKSWMNSTWSTSSGSTIYTPVLPYDWCSQLGINYYPTTSAFTLLSKTDLNNVGTVTLTEASADGVRSLIVTITYLSGYTVDKSYLFVGSEDELEATVQSSGCPDYTSWMFQDEPDNSNVQVFVIPL